MNPRKLALLNKVFQYDNSPSKIREVVAIYHRNPEHKARGNVVIRGFDKGKKKYMLQIQSPSGEELSDTLYFNTEQELKSFMRKHRLGFGN